MEKLKPKPIPTSQLGREFNFGNPEPHQVETLAEFDLWRKDKSFFDMLRAHLDSRAGSANFRKILSEHLALLPEPENWYPEEEDEFEFWRKKRTLVDMGDILNDIQSKNLMVNNVFYRMLSSFYYRVTEYRQYRAPSPYDWMA